MAWSACLLLLSWPLQDHRPPLSDAARLPCHEDLRQYRWDNFSYQDEVWHKLQAYPDWPGAKAALEEARAIGIWHGLALEATCQGLGEGLRRDALAEMRKLMGPAAYALGRWPPAVPVWRLPRP